MAASLNCPDILKKYQSKQKNQVAGSKAAKSGKGSKAAVSKKSKTSKKSKSPSKPKTKAAKKQTVATDDENEEEQDWEVEKIIDVRYNEDATKNFLIRWKGCDPTQDTWEPENNVNSPELVNAFMSKADGTDDVSAPKKKSRKV